MLGYYAVPVVATVASSFWLLSRSNRRVNDVESLLKTINADLSDAIWRFAGGLDRSEDDQLWVSIHEWKGMLEIWQHAGLFVTIIRILAKQYPDRASQEYRELWWAAIYLRICFGSCLVEAIFRKFAPIPRVQLREFVRLYCDMLSSVQVVSGACK